MLVSIEFFPKRKKQLIHRLTILVLIVQQMACVLSEKDKKPAWMNPSLSDEERGKLFMAEDNKKHKGFWGKTKKFGKGLFGFAKGTSSLALEMADAYNTFKYGSMSRRNQGYGGLDNYGGYGFGGGGYGLGGEGYGLGGGGYGLGGGGYGLSGSNKEIELAKSIQQYKKDELNQEVQAMKEAQVPSWIETNWLPLLIAFIIANVLIVFFVSNTNRNSNQPMSDPYFIDRYSLRQQNKFKHKSKSSKKNKKRNHKTLRGITSRKRIFRRRKKTPKKDHK